MRKKHAALVLDFFLIQLQKSVGRVIELTWVGFSIAGRWGTFSMKKKPEPTRPEFYGVWHPALGHWDKKKWRFLWRSFAVKVNRVNPVTSRVDRPGALGGEVMAACHSLVWWTAEFCHCAEHPGTILGVSEFGRCSLAIQSLWLLSLISCKKWGATTT